MHTNQHNTTPMDNNMKTQKSDSAISMNMITAAEWRELLPCVKAVIKKVWDGPKKKGAEDSSRRKALSYMLDKDDLESEAFLVCCKCKQAYHEEKGASFKTYFRHALEHELSDKLRCGNMSIFSGSRETCKRMGRATREFGTREDTEISLAQLKKMYPDEKESTLRTDLAFWKSNRFDLDATYEDGGDGYGMVEDEACISPRLAALQRDWEVLMDALAPAERLILEALQGYGNEGEACKRLRISRPTFRRRKAELLNRLRLDADWQLMRECMA